VHHRSFRWRLWLCQRDFQRFRSDATKNSYFRRCGRYFIRFNGTSTFFGNDL